MAGAETTFKKMKKRIGGQIEEGFKNPLSTIDPIGHMEESISDITGLFTPDVPEPEEETIIPIPSDRESQLKARKKRARTKTSGRESTILTEGLGG